MTDWLTVVDEQSTLVSRMTRDVPKALRDPNLTLDIASKVGDLVSKGARDYYTLYDRMQQDPSCTSLVDTAARLKGVWSGLALMAANRIRAIQGMSPVTLN